MTSRDVIFFENFFHTKLRVQESGDNIRLRELFVSEAIWR